MNKTYWRSLNELAQTPEFLEMAHREFPMAATELPEGMSRRRWLQLMGASLSLGGLAGCAWQIDTIAPMTQRPANRTPGVPKFFATGWENAGYGEPLLVRNYDGRPIKIEGNDRHPYFAVPEGQRSRGPSSQFAQASILEFYDPDRLRNPVRRTTKTRTGRQDPEPATWRQFEHEAEQVLKQYRPEKIAVLAEPSSSPSLAAMRDRFLKAYPGSRWFEYESISRDNEHQGAIEAFGEPLRAHMHFDKAKVVVCLDADPFRWHPNALRHQMDWVKRREPVWTGKVGESQLKKDEMGRLYVIESQFSVTGANADHRLSLPSSQIGAFLALLEARVPNAASEDASTLAGIDEELDVAESEHLRVALAAVGDLIRNRGQGLLVVGPSQPAAIHARVHLLNQRLGNLNETVIFTAEPLKEATPDRYVDQLKELVDGLENNQYGVLLVLGGNPVYAAPADVDVAGALSKVGLSIRLGLYDDETAQHCDWTVPLAHPLESWGDTRTYDGTVTLIQPQTYPIVNERAALTEPTAEERRQGPTLHDALMHSLAEEGFHDLPDVQHLHILAWEAPEREEVNEGQATGAVFNGPLAKAKVNATEIQKKIIELLAPRSAIELLAVLIGDDDWHGKTIVRQTLNREYSLDDAGWRKAVHDGFVANTALAAVSVKVRDSIKAGEERISREAPSNGKLEVIFQTSGHTYDGRFANNSWLIETPDFLTKITWENPVLMGVQTASDLGVKDSTLVRVRYKGRAIEDAMPVYVLPGMARGTVCLTLGFGRTMAGMVGGYTPVEIDTVGVDVGQLRTSEAMSFDSGLEIEPLGVPYRLSSTQDHYLIDTIGRNEVSRRSPELVRQLSLEQYEENPGALSEVHLPETGLKSLWNLERGRTQDSMLEKKAENQNLVRHAWGLSIDLNKCMGCNACVTACQAENNVPVVGKEQVFNSREMHWLRIDRYFRGSFEEPDKVDLLFQPMLCQQCENAPCEQVCPVAATTHSDEGLNDMAYNRCVGTRYCANNCPYKVRRFNFFHYTKPLKYDENILQRMVINPEVTVRSRGVMEKCTFCVQRIESAKIHSKNEMRPIADGEIVTACEQACPTNAIVFGNLFDAESRVSKLHKDKRSYALLEELYTAPRNLYMVRLRNRHPHPHFEERWLETPHHGHEEAGEHGDHEHDHDHEHEGVEAS